MQNFKCKIKHYLSSNRYHISFLSEFKTYSLQTTAIDTVLFLIEHIPCEEILLEIPKSKQNASKIQVLLKELEKKRKKVSLKTF